MIDINKLKRIALDGDLFAIQELITRLEDAEQDAARFRWLAMTTSEDDSYNETHANWPSGRLADCVDAAMKETK